MAYKNHDLLHSWIVRSRYEHRYVSSSVKCESPHLSMLHTEKLEGLVDKHTCIMPLCIMPCTYRKVTLCSLEHWPLQATCFKRVSCKSHTYDLVRTGALTKLLTSRVQVKHAPGSTVFQHCNIGSGLGISTSQSKSLWKEIRLSYN